MEHVRTHGADAVGQALLTGKVDRDKRIKRG